MRKGLLGVGALLLVAAIGFFGILPGYVEASMNHIDGKPLPKVSAEAVALHKTLTIVDMHSDTLMWKRDVLDKADRGHMDLPRLQAGNVALQVFSSVSKTPKDQNYDSNGADTDNITLLTFVQMQPMRTWSSLLERSLWHAQKLDTAVKTNRGLIKIGRAENIEDLSWKRESKAANSCAHPHKKNLLVSGNKSGAIPQTGEIISKHVRVASGRHKSPHRFR